MMTTKNANDLSMVNLENRVANGHRDAMVQYLAASLTQGLTNSELMRRYQLVWVSDHGNDSMVLRNLAFVAAAAGEFERSFAHAEDFESSDFYPDAMHTALAVIERGRVEEHKRALAILTRLAKKRHIMSQVHLRYQETKDGGISKKFHFFLYRIAKLIQASILVLRNPKDPRVQV